MLLRVVHYVADAYGYRTVEPRQAVTVYPEDEETKSLQELDDRRKLKGVVTEWKSLYFPRGCGMFEGGVRPDIPVVALPDGGYTNVNNTKINEI